MQWLELMRQFADVVGRALAKRWIVHRMPTHSGDHEGSEFSGRRDAQEEQDSNEKRV
jgi:hypothetical protein